MGMASQESETTMGDLAQAIVDLGRTSEQRRTARRSLREATAVVIAAMLQHLRVGDQAWLDAKREDDGSEDVFGPSKRLYRIERVGWRVADKTPLDPDGVPVRCTPIDQFGSHPKGAPTLVRYDETMSLDKDGRRYQGAVLLDVRSDYVDSEGLVHPVDGRDIWRIEPSDEEHSPQVDLHLATDHELLLFARDAATIVQRINRHFSFEAKVFTDAAEDIARLSPR